MDGRKPEHYQGKSDRLQGMAAGALQNEQCKQHAGSPEWISGLYGRNAEPGEDGKGTEADMEKARRWYTLAAEQGRPDAAYKLGQFYEHGIGVEEDMEKAEEWYQKAAEEAVEEEITIIEEEKKDTSVTDEEMQRLRAKAKEVESQLNTNKDV